MYSHLCHPHFTMTVVASKPGYHLPICMSSMSRMMQTLCTSFSDGDGGEPQCIGGSGYGSGWASAEGCSMVTIIGFFVVFFILPLVPLLPDMMFFYVDVRRTTSEIATDDGVCIHFAHAIRTFWARRQRSVRALDA